MLGGADAGWEPLANCPCVDCEPAANTECRLASLPAELISNILSYLSAYDLISVSETCRALHEHAMTDRLWQDLVQDHVPGVRVTSPYPYDNFHDLFRAHDPRWFLPKHKIWFSDADLPGRLILVRYDQRRGCIEGYQLLANRRSRSFYRWNAEPSVTIHSFDPLVKLHLDNPILRLPPDPGAETYERQPFGEIITIKLHGASNDTNDRSRFQAEIPMQLGSIENMRSNFMYARTLTPAEIERRASLHLPYGQSSLDFPYGQIWPPPTMPTKHRVLGDGLGRSRFTPHAALGPESRPNNRSQLCDRAFRIRKWIVFRMYHPPGFLETGAGTIIPGELGQGVMGQPGDIDPGFSDWNPSRNPGYREIRGWEEISTFATLDPELYTPTQEKPYQGIWVGDYSGHECEFLWIHHQDDGHRPEDLFTLRNTPPDSPRELAPREGESEEESANRKLDATSGHRGRLVAVKLTGDENVPRGEYTWVVDDLGEKGFLRVETQPPFEGVRVVKSRGHVGNAGFLDGKSCRLMMLSSFLLQYGVADLPQRQTRTSTRNCF